MSAAATLVLRWVDVYTCLAPPEVRERRLAEMRSHVHEATVSGVGGSRLLTEAVAGAAADLVWCDDVRRSVGALGLLASLTYSFEAATAAALVCVAVTFVLTSVRPRQTSMGMAWVLIAVSLMFPAIAVAHRAIARRRR